MKFWYIPAAVVAVVVFTTFVSSVAMADARGSKPTQGSWDHSGFYHEEIQDYGDHKTNNKTDRKHPPAE